MDAFAPFEAALTFLMQPTREASVPDTKATLLDLIRLAVTEGFVWLHKPTDNVVHAIANFTGHVRNNLQTWLTEEYGINVREDMCKDAYKEREGVNDVTHTLRTYAPEMVKNFAKTRDFVHGKESAAAVMTVLAAAVKELLPEIWLDVWTEVTVYSLLCLIHGLQFTVYCLQNYGLRFKVYCLLSTVYSLLVESSIYRLLLTVYCLLFTVYGVLFTVYYLLSAVYSLRFTV
jgi:hypothetical protein